MQGGSDGGSGLPAWLTSLESETREQARTELEEQAMASTSQQPYVPPTPTVANDATFGQGVRDAGLSDDDCGVAQAEAFSGMTAEQRFMMDAYGYIRVPSVLSPSAVEAMRDGSFSESRGGQPGGFGGRRSDPLSFPDMEALATHPAILDVMMELMEGAPRLVQSTTWHDEPATPGAVEQMPQVLHSQRERDRRYVSFGTRPPGRISCNNVVVFVYLDAVRDGDGGLCVLPGSHKSMFSRPRTLFGTYGNHSDPGCPAAAPADLPEGLLHVKVEPGDVLIITEATTHGVIPWRAVDRPRRYVRFRYKSGVCFEEHCVAQRGARQSVAGGGSWGKPWSPEFVAGLSPKTRAIVGGAFDMHGAFDHRGEAKL